MCCSTDLAMIVLSFFFFFQAEDGIRDVAVTGVQTCALPICIVGGNIPVATGAGLAQKLMKKDSVVLCFFGDGASNTGNFHESLNMAALWKLPVVYIVEKNLDGVAGAPGEGAG